MFNLARPSITAGEIFDAASERFLDADLRKRYASAKWQFLGYDAGYVERGETYSLHLIPEGNPAEALVSSGDLQNLYTLGLLRRRSKARLLYEEIRLSSPFNTCPYCNHRIVASLDHYLAKSKHPLLAISPCNLVPACSDCNKAKLDSACNSFEESLIHPYFDNFEGIVWLACKLEKLHGGWVGRFSIDRTGLHESNVKKLENHFSRLGLWELYTIESATELSRQELLVDSYRKADGVEGVTEFLQRSLSSNEAHSKNHWRTALARACLHSQDYLSGT